MADERSVDVDEPRDTPPPADRGPRAVAAASRLSPMQEAWGRYVGHSLHECRTCRSADGSACPAAEALYAAYQQLAGRAFEQIRREP
jgi:hypothetical protein